MNFLELNEWPSGATGLVLSGVFSLSIACNVNRGANELLLRCKPLEYNIKPLRFWFCYLRTSYDFVWLFLLACHNLINAYSIHKINDWIGTTQKPNSKADTYSSRQNPFNNEKTIYFPCNDYLHYLTFFQSSYC